MKKQIFVLCAVFSLVMMLGLSASAAEEQDDINEESKIDSYIYELVEDYENGTFEERNDLPDVDAHMLLKPEEIENLQVEHIYDNRQIGENEFVASRISFYDLDKSDQNEQDGVVIYVAIQYDKKDFGDPWDYIMLNRVKGGVVRQEGNVSCSSISFRYYVTGDAYNADGSRAGLKGNSVYYNGELENPKIGTTYYIEGPKDYYYNMGVINSVVAGFMRATLSNGSQFEVSIDISSI